MSSEAEAVLAFWLGERTESPPDDETVERWFAADPALDARIRTRFGETVERALAGGCDDWAEAGAESRVALIIVLDQFPRNLFRDDARAFAGDSAALRWAREAVREPVEACHPLERYFALLPFMHAESIEAQQEGVAAFHLEATRSAPAFQPLFERGAEFADRHRVVIERFGRFPHRNGVLGRTSTPEEEAHLAAFPSGF